ncbi:hypothetical protein INT45_007462 [Circinella minor]|uniref:Uncharacterized protein n=1 Tax=Circinella minor TaxID=1195481 RepID=A0A8H7VQB7_9FUNG|nr:hypothetical protein INT45_007462 [Circinella minor]
MTTIGNSTVTEIDGTTSVTAIHTDETLFTTAYVANSTDDLLASVDMTRHNDTDLLDLPGHQTSSTLLSHANALANDSGDKRPDATLTKLIQLSYEPRLGFGEAKVVQPTTNNNDLCHDLLRLGIFCKEAINTHHGNACLAFQIHGFTITFYLMRLRHDGVYTMYEIAKVLFPRSLEELSSFISLKNLRSLAQVSESFWRLCQIRTCFGN